MYEYKAIVTGVYDGDSITVDVDLGMRVWLHKQKLRLAEIDAKPIKGAEREAGLAARDFLRELVLGKQVVIRTKKDIKEKYGRWLAEIELGGVIVNDLMLSNGHALEYGK